MAATTTTTAPSEATPRDEQIISQLATLQSLHAKILQLRSLLPERLIDPVKAGIEASRAGYEPPAALAAHLRSVAVDGDRDVKEFKELWRSEEMREVWRASKESAFPQGSDVWGVEYRDLVVDVGKEGEGAGEENVEELFEKFRTGSPKIKLERGNDADGGPFADVTVVGQTFAIRKSEKGSVGEWIVSSKAGSQVTERLRNILRSLEERPNKRSLEFLLDMIASYTDLKTQACEKCKNVFDDDIQLPTARTANPNTESNKNQFLAYHSGCL